MGTLGSNIGFVDELYARFRADPTQVSEAWREFFLDYRPSQPELRGAPAAGPAPVAAPATAAVLASAPALEDRSGTLLATTPSGVHEQALTGVSLRIAENMKASLHVPTATSTRTVAVKLLEENRRVINLHQDMVGQAKVSFTYLIAWAIVRALDKHPHMNDGFIEKDGASFRLEREQVNLGLAIDVERKGERLLLVPNIKNAARLDLRAFIAAYDDVIARARSNKLVVADYQDTTVTLTNPGMIGTLMSVPRLMDGQGTILGVGNIGYPAEYAGMAPEVKTELGLSKVMTITSTYDHRVIQGAESGSFLATLDKLLLGEEDFYADIFAALGVPTEAVRWAGDQNPPAFAALGSSEAIEKQAMVLQLIRAHRVRGHLRADLDPLHVEEERHPPELELSSYGLSVWDLDRRFITGGLAGDKGMRPLRDILDILRQTYCGHIGVEFMHIPEGDRRDWLQQRMESTRNSAPLGPEVQHRILERLNAAEAFERFLHTTYVGHKRFSLEGGETLVPMLDALLNLAAASGFTSAVLGMAHRGRLNVLANIVGKSYGSIFREFEGDPDPSSAHGSGDVKYHLGASGVHMAPGGLRLEVVLASNPSHLEAVDPVVEGMARALQDLVGDAGRERVLPILVHGDAAFAGQGVVAETLNLSELSGYTTGGTVHIIVNNRIGFTTDPKDARSSIYPTDVAKAVASPIFHVNGDRPEDALRAIALALEFRREFHHDAVVDLVCYRRWGHNEGDEPSYTNPVMYAAIEKHRSVRKVYTEQLLRRGDVSVAAAEQALVEFQRLLQAAHDDVRRATAQKDPVDESRPVADSSGLKDDDGPDETVATASRDALLQVLRGLDTLPDGFALHPKLHKQFERRREHFAGGQIEWGFAESLAFGSLVLGGVPVRLSGQDSGRGTFSQRHAKLYDHHDGALFVPLAHLRDSQAPFAVCDSLLSEFAVLGFEYGYSVKRPEALVCWEAQFGDFANGAQVIIDQFIAASEAKWGQRAGLTLLLPHGQEGQGPEHSSARIERFLQLASGRNLRVCYPSTPASYFHLLRRQALLAEKKPLVVFTPKSMLRHPQAVSRVEDLTDGSFVTVLDDSPRAAPKTTRRVVLCAGKLYYDLAAEQRKRGVGDVALVRLEQFYPFPATRLAALLRGAYAGAAEVVWAQEEPCNMGAWPFLQERVTRLLASGQTLRYVGRPAAASAATGSHKRHLVEQETLVAEALTML